MEFVFVKGALRIAVIVCAGILTLVSAITVGIVSNNRDFDRIGDYRSSQSIKQLENLVDNTLSTSVWLLILSFIVVVWEGLYTALPSISSRLAFLQRYAVVLAITDAGFSGVALVCFLGSMIACVVLADGWGGPPEVCDRYSVYYQRLDCDHSQLEGTNGTAALLCVVQMGLMVVLGVLAGLGCLPVMLASFQRPRHAPKRSRRTRPSEEEPAVADTE